MYAIVDVGACARARQDPLETARAFLAGGARWLQLRAKSLDSRAFLELARATVAVAAPLDALVIVNDRADIALMAGAGGVHVGQEDVPPAVARRLLGAGAVVGCSTHTVAQIEAALDQPVDYIAVGPVFATATKDTGYAAVGLDLVAQAAARAAPRGIPVVAIGGITIETSASVIAAGAAAVAVIGDLLRSPGRGEGAAVPALVRMLGAR